MHSPPLEVKVDLKCSYHCNVQHRTIRELVTLLVNSVRHDRLKVPYTCVHMISSFPFPEFFLFGCSHNVSWEPEKIGKNENGIYWHFQTASYFLDTWHVLLGLQVCQINLKLVTLIVMKMMKQQQKDTSNRFVLFLYYFILSISFKLNLVFSLLSRIECKYCSISTSYFLLQIWKNCVCFGVFSPVRTLCDAYHKQFGAH